MSEPRRIYAREEIDERVREVGREIAADGIGAPLVAVCVIKGAVVFFADLVRSINGADVRFAFVAAKSYKADGNRMTSAGEVKLEYVSFSPEEIKSADVLLVEDIVDTGRTIAALKAYCESLGAERVRIAALLDKPDCRVADVAPDYAAFTIKGDPYIVGYGLDNMQKYRNLDGIFVI